MLNILHLIGFLGRGGDTSVILEVDKFMDKKEIHFDFLTHKGSTDMELVHTLESRGSKVYFLDGDVRKLGPIKYYREVRKILKNAEIKYDVIHTHTSLQSGVALLAAKKEGIKLRICHSHVSSIQRKASGIKKIVSVPILKYLIALSANKKVACSKMAGIFLYGKSRDFIVVYNGIDIEKYQAVTSDDIKKVREELCLLDNDIIIGHVAHFGDLKNQIFDIDLVYKLVDRPDIKFILVGSGNNFEKIKMDSAEFSDKMILTGQRSDIPILMNIFDCVILPSLPGEGFPVTIMEAQAAGCKCIVSENVTSEVEVGLGLVKNISLENQSAWIEEIRAIQKNSNSIERYQYAKKLAALGFDKKEFVDRWLALYE